MKMLEVIHSRGLPLDRITTTDVWATNTISANLPPMEAFKNRMDEWIWQHYRIEVEHLCARNKDGSKRTYEQMFYHVPVRRSQTSRVERESRFRPEDIRGFPMHGMPWCQAILKRSARLPSAGKYQGIPRDLACQMVPETQESMPGRRISGFPAQISPWCRKLKIDKVKTPLFGRARHDGQGQKYRGIFGDRCR